MLVLIIKGMINWKFMLGTCYRLYLFVLCNIFLCQLYLHCDSCGICVWKVSCFLHYSPLQLRLTQSGPQHPEVLLRSPSQPKHIGDRNPRGIPLFLYSRDKEPMGIWDNTRPSNCQEASAPSEMNFSKNHNDHLTVRILGMYMTHVWHTEGMNECRLSGSHSCSETTSGAGNRSLFLLSLFPPSLVAQPFK